MSYWTFMAGQIATEFFVVIIFLATIASRFDASFADIQIVAELDAPSIPTVAFILLTLIAILVTYGIFFTSGMQKESATS